MVTRMTTFYKIAYGALFVVLLPLLLVFWCGKLDAAFPLPMPPWKDLGAILGITGALTMLWSMLALRIYGNGLPMNAFPPDRFVSQGPYRIIPHPIYCGASLLTFGAALWLESPAGLWIGAPGFTLAAVALTLGYERQAIHQRFGVPAQQTLLRLPLDAPQRRDGADILSAIVLTGLPWFFVYEAALFWGKFYGGVELSFDFERTFPVWQQTTILYSFTYVFVGLTPFFLRSKHALRRLMVAGNSATIIGGILFFTLPILAIPRPFIPSGFFGELLMQERAFDGASAAFPSFHALWAMLAARALSKEYPRYKVVFIGLGLAISASCFTTGMHSVADITAGIFLGLLCFEYRSIWQFTLRTAERIANSWHEWHFGPVRVINHGMYAGLATLAGTLMVSCLLGGNELAGVTLVTLSSMIGAALWAQFVEGSPALLRPFGYYGAIFGSTLACILWSIFGGNTWSLLAAFSVAAPCIQSLGRLRCLVQGCCHGALNAESLGIHVTHPRSRICRLSDLGGANLYPTQVYSIVWNILITPLLVRMWFAGLPASTIIGAYLLLSSLGRFVEEGYRGEPQTHSFGGLRLYQWLSVGLAITGGWLMTVPSAAVQPTLGFSWAGASLSFVLGCVAWFALGIDFPNSSRRFSRLT